MRRGPLGLSLLLCCCGVEPSPPTPEPVVEAPEAAPVENDRPEEPSPAPAVPSGSEAHTTAMRARAADPTAAVHAMEDLCDRGYAPSCVVLAEMLEAGEGVEADPARAQGALEQACMGGSTEACDRLGH